MILRSKLLSMLQEMDDYKTVAEVYAKVSHIERGYPSGIGAIQGLVCAVTGLTNLEKVVIRR